MADSSFDIVSKVDRQEADNAVNQAAKELATRFDFRGVDATVAWTGDETLLLSAQTEERVKAAVEVFKEKLIKRGLSLKAVKFDDPAPSGKIYQVKAALKQGIDQEHAKKIGKKIRDEGPKGIRVQVQGDELRVFSKKRDDLQAVITLVKGGDFDVALQFTNYR
ncbi:MAG: YajQ family cyclic di-GMP-binding protein [Segniliparus sp.]|uniref:YajQ family cyclic di-GMP-binding protein n=1 Tax=Segniliparus sp. TaxID=2804064 RepID=UPI003F3F75F1